MMTLIRSTLIQNRLRNLSLNFKYLERYFMKKFNLLLILSFVSLTPVQMILIFLHDSQQVIMVHNVDIS